jgi:hypothetical protein
MTALLITLYLVGFLGMAGFILLILGVGAMFGSYPTRDIWKAFAFASIWPFLILWGAANFTVYKIRN